MPDPIEALKGFEKRKDFFVGVDSDGCAFDSMEIKHKECFIPNTINSWGLQPVSRFAREAAEFVNLYSQWRGINRFPALTMVFDLLATRPEVIARGFNAPQVDPLREWMERQTRLSSSTLTDEVGRTKDPVLIKALEWSDVVNATITKIVRNVPPFPGVSQSLEKLAEVADVMVVSATPGETLEREWIEYGIAEYVGMICGQEMGSKNEHLQYGAGGKYAPEKILMIGDAPGDMKAAKANDACFYPIVPGQESASWERFFDESAERFLSGQYGGSYEQELIDEFMTHLPSVPPWQAAG